MVNIETMWAQSLPEPPMLDGTENYAIYEQWQMKMRVKLNWFDRVYHSTEYAINYLASRLSGLAFDVVKPRLKFDKGAGKLWRTTDEMWQELEKLFKLSKDERLRIYKDKFVDESHLNLQQYDWYSQCGRYKLSGTIPQLQALHTTTSTTS